MSQNATTTAMESRLLPEPAADRELARRLARGAAGSFEELVELHADAVTRTARGLLGWQGDVDDVIQDVFVVALEKSPRFRGQCSLRTWLTVITLNRCRTYHRRQKIWRRVLNVLGRQAPEPAAADPPGPGDETARAVRTAVASLAPADREVVVLHYFEHKSPAQIGELLGASQNAVEVRLHRARAKLRRMLRALLEE
jgi:RNA polymerase sigma factor (sigma-70 family)